MCVSMLVPTQANDIVLYIIINANKEPDADEKPQCYLCSKFLAIHINGPRSPRPPLSHLTWSPRLATPQASL